MSKAKTFVRKVLPAVMTVVGCVSTVAAVIFAAKEGPRYEKEVEETGAQGIQKVKTAVKVFAPAIGCAAVSVGCSVGAHLMDLNTQASITGGYIALKEAAKKYRNKNLELNGENADKTVVTSIQEEKLPEDVRSIGGDTPITVVLCRLCDDISEISFQSTRMEVMESIYTLNKFLVTLGDFNVNDVLKVFGQDTIEGGNDVGWSYEMLSMIQGENWLDFIQYTNPDGSLSVMPCVPASGDYLSAFNLDY